MKRYGVFAASAALALGIASCGAAVEAEAEPTPEASVLEGPTSQETATETMETVESDEPEEAPDEPVWSRRGNLVKEIGELGGLTDEDGELLIGFWVDEIQVDFECTRESPDAPLNGHFVGIKFQVETSPGLADEPDGEFWLSHHDMSAWTSDGKRVNDPVGNAFWCADDADLLPSRIGPGEGAEGWIVLDLPSNAEAVGLTLYTASGRAGWEWVIAD